MTSQREALQSVLDSFDTSLAREFRLLFLSAWLEDINWHAENRMLWNLAPERFTKNACEIESRVQEIRETLEPRLSLAGRHEETHNLRYNVEKMEYFRALNLIFGWGIQNDSFEFTMGEPLVRDLLAMAGVTPVEQSTCPDCNGTANNHLRASCNE